MILPSLLVTVLVFHSTSELESCGRAAVAPVAAHSAQANPHKSLRSLALALTTTHISFTQNHFTRFLPEVNMEFYKPGITNHSILISTQDWPMVGEPLLGVLHVLAIFGETFERLEEEEGGDFLADIRERNKSLQCEVLAALIALKVPHPLSLKHGSQLHLEEDRTKRLIMISGTFWRYQIYIKSLHQFVKCTRRALFARSRTADCSIVKVLPLF